MASLQRQEEELDSLTYIYDAKELSVLGADSGVFRAYVRTPPDIVIRSEDAECHSLQHLPPLVLHYMLPLEYPEHEPPIFILTGYWLSHDHLSRLCRRLDELFVPGQEALYIWFTFLMEDAWSFLGLEDTLFISEIPLQPISQPLQVEGKAAKLDFTYEEKGWQKGTNSSAESSIGEDSPVENSKEVEEQDLVKVDGCGDPGMEKTSALLDPRAVVEIVTPPGLREMLVAYANVQERSEFNKNMQECAVCFSLLQGFQSLRFEPCKHVFCEECAAQYLREATKRPTKATCPGSQCNSLVPHHLVQKLLSEEEFQRYDSRLLEMALAALPDIKRCPRTSCQYAVTWDSADGKLATCFKCHYAFCVECRQGFHGVEPCRFRPQEVQQLLVAYSSGNATERAALEKQHGRRRLEELVQSVLTNTWLEDNSKSCPHCKACIQKAEGCNKMVCWRCNTHFCWLCLERLDPLIVYEHFLALGSPCYRLLFQGVDPNLAEAIDHLEIEEEPLNDT